MSTFPTLPVGPFEHLSMDYARLRAEALRLLERLGSAQWTDFNAHDPGITILEQLCYAITDLGYRTAFPMQELLAGFPSWLPGPEAILTTDPVTRADVRKLALDAEGVGNAWVEEMDEPEVPIYFHAGSRQLHLRADPGEPDAAPVRLRGLQRVVLQTTGSIAGELARASVAARLHAARGLANDFQVALLDTFPVGLHAEIEVGAADDPVAVMAEIVERIDAYLAPKARFTSRAAARAGGRATDDVLDGPLLEHGFVDLLPDPRRTIYMSDLLHVILDVPAVKAVRSLVLQGAASDPERWVLEIPAGQVAVLAPLDLGRGPDAPAPQGRSTRLTLFRRGLPLRVDAAEVRRRLDELQVERARAATDPGDPVAPAPRTRDLTRHLSIQYQLPAAYGVGPLGLPASASVERRAQARQLAAYLLIFDQLFANALAQLSHARELLAPGDGPVRTYFSQPVENERLGLEELLVQEAGAHRAWLEEKVEAGDPLERHLRFLAHLLARYAEELGDYSLLEEANLPEGGSWGEALVADRRAFLRDYPRLSRARGSGHDVIRHGSEGSGAGFAERLRHKLGLRGGGPRLHVVEHVLLRPLAEDLAQLSGEGEPQVPLLAGVNGPDPWSLVASVVLEERERPDPAFEKLVEQTILAETPAHLTVRLHWFGDGDGGHWSAFDRAWGDFRAAYRDYRVAKLDGRRVPVELQLAVRDARDRVIDLLEIGRTYPLRDVPLPREIFVPSGERARIPLSFSQEGVVYELRDRVSGERVLDGGVPITAGGEGGPIELVTPPTNEDVSYRILAVKREGAQTPELRREAWLRAVVSVVEGLDPRLVAEIRLPLLDARIDAPRPTDARLGDWGVRAEIEIFESQEGVSYEIIEDAPDLSDPDAHRVVSEGPVIGTSGTIALRTVAIEEDVDLRIRGEKSNVSPEGTAVRRGILDQVLLLRVRANPGLPVKLTPEVVAYGGTAVAQLSSTQASVEYTPYQARVRDRDYAFDPPSSLATVDIPDGGRTVRLLRPPRLATWEDLPGYAPAGDVTRGTGDALPLAFGAPGPSGAFLLVKATKRHQAGPLGTGSEEIASSVQLAGAAAVLVQPNPAQPLRLGVEMAGEAATGALLVEGGEPGVLYEFRIDGREEPIGRPAYFHQRDDEDERLNKGIGQLRVEVDGVIARDAAGAESAPAGDRTPPAAPRLDAVPLEEGTVLRVMARRAMSGLEAPLDRPAAIPAAPAVKVEPASVAPGASADIVIEGSRTDERYRLSRAGQRIGEEVAGTGGRIALPTGPLEEAGMLTVTVIRADGSALAVERSVEVAVEVA